MSTQPDPGEAMTADTSPCSPEDFWADEGTESAPLAPSVPDPAPETVRTPTDPAAAQDGRTTERFDVADLRSCIDRLSKRALAAEAEVERLRETLWPDDMFRRTLVRAEVAEDEVERLRSRIKTLAHNMVRECIERIPLDQGDPVRAAFTDRLATRAREVRALADPEPEQVQQADEVPTACCGHTHAPEGCTGPPTPSDVWAGVSPSVCDCDEPTTPTETKD